MSVEEAKAGVVVVDALKLRRAGILRLVKDWCAANSLDVTAVAPLGLRTEIEIRPSCQMVLLSIGGSSVHSREIAHCIESVHALLPDTPLVIIADDDNADEIILAFRVGARAYIPTSMEPAIALTALTFVLSGGSYFPPKALLSATAPSAESETSGSLSEGDEKTEPQAKSLTMRQQEVIGLLREGMPNKLIARHLRMTEATVKVHVRQIMRKLGATNRTQAALCASKVHGIAIQQLQVVSHGNVPLATPSSLATCAGGQRHATEDGGRYLSS
jgi:DNA-binding NarL/FixJ family response regulator